MRIRYKKKCQTTNIILKNSTMATIHYNSFVNKIECKAMTILTKADQQSIKR